MGRSLLDSPDTWWAGGMAWHSHFRAQKHLSGPPIMLGTRAEILSATPPSALSRPREVGKYRNQISGVEAAEAVVGKCFGLARPPPLSWESNPLALPSPSLQAPKSSWLFSGLCLAWVSPRHLAVPGSGGDFCILDLLSLEERQSNREPHPADTPCPGKLGLWAAFLSPQGPCPFLWPRCFAHLGAWAEASGFQGDPSWRECLVGVSGFHRGRVRIISLLSLPHGQAEHQSDGIEGGRDS